MKRLARFSARAADAVLAAMLAALFLTFLLQIADRYLLGARFGWTLELTLTLWLWLVLFGAGVVLRDADDVKFDMLATAVRPQLQRLFALVAALAMITALMASLPATIDYVTFYKIKRSATLGIRLDYVFAVVVLFFLGLIIRYAVMAWRAIRGSSP